MTPNSTLNAFQAKRQRLLTGHIDGADAGLVENALAYANYLMDDLDHSQPAGHVVTVLDGLGVKDVTHADAHECSRGVVLLQTAVNLTRSFDVEYIPNRFRCQCFPPPNSLGIYFVFRYPGYGYLKLIRNPKIKMIANAILTITRRANSDFSMWRKTADCSRCSDRIAASNASVAEAAFG